MDDLRGQSNDKQEQIGDSQAEQVVVRGRLHVLVLGDDDARADVANDTADEDEHMEDGDEDSVEADAANVAVEIRGVEAEAMVDEVIEVDVGSKQVLAGVAVERVDTGRTEQTDTCIHSIYFQFYVVVELICECC